MSDAAIMAQRLGLAISPFFPANSVIPRGQHFALLDGRRASFVCSVASSAEIPEQDSKDWQWSADLAHHVLLSPAAVEVRSGRDLVRRFERKSVDTRLEEFVNFLTARRSVLPDIVPFLVNEFREIWAISGSQNGNEALAAFLLSLHAADLKTEVLSDASWCRATAQEIGLDPAAIGSGLNDQTVLRARGIQSRAKPLGVQLIPSLVLRHAAGRLFQEAHAVLEYQQLGLFGDSTIVTVPHYSPLGAYFTPVPIARMLAEWALQRWFHSEGNLTIADYACGSGVFLTEGLRALERNGFRGTVRIVGRDKSQQAITMAKVAVQGVRTDLTTIHVDCDILEADAFETTWPKADVVLMNPPFRSWERMSALEREWVRELTKESGHGRPDLSVGFIERAIRVVNQSGVVATLLPAGVLSSESLKKWRDTLVQRATPTLVAVLGEHGLFQHALVNVGMVALGGVGVETSRSSNPRLHLAWASADAGSSSKTIRAIRRSMSEMDNPEESVGGAGWSVTESSLNSWKRRPSWLPGAGALGSLLEIIETKTPTTVGDLFRVRQGIRTGANEVFIRSAKEIDELPQSEHKYFKPAVDAASFVGGELRPQHYLFLPDPQWKTEAEVSQSVPVFFDRYITTAKSSLHQRKSLLDDRYWKLTRPRGWMFNGRPRLISKRFGLYPAFARDFDGTFAVVQANAWIPTGALNSGKDDSVIRETLTSYWWFLNSRVFVSMLREYCPNVAGGQLDLENKYVKNVPIPDLLKQMQGNPALQALAVSMRAANAESLPRTLDLDHFAAIAYGAELSEWNLSGLELPSNGR